VHSAFDSFTINAAILHRSKVEARAAFSRKRAILLRPPSWHEQRSKYLQAGQVPERRNAIRESPMPTNESGGKTRRR
jgi:hypothetical protein